MKIALLFADGTEEIEALTPFDYLVRGGAKCDIFSLSGEIINGLHGIKVKADKLIKDLDISEYDGIIVPGGSIGSVTISENTKAVEEIKRAYINGKMVASICASPAVVLAGKEIVKGKKLTCYPAEKFIEVIGKNNTYTGADVEIDGNVITANGVRSSDKFGIAICEYLGLKARF